MITPPFSDCYILWIEDQIDEYDPLIDEFELLVGQDHILVANTMYAGRSQLQERAFNLLLLDLMLPHNEDDRSLDFVHLEAGIQLLEELRQKEGWATDRNCKVIVFTARGDKNALSNVNNLLGSDGCLIQKPSLIEHVVQVVKNMLESDQKS